MTSPSLFFTADLHLNHGNIIKYCNRPFSNVGEMNEAIITRHNSVVKPQDHTFILGDLAFHTHPRDLKAMLDRMNGTKEIILGNHDKFEGHGFHGIRTHYRILELKGKDWFPYNPTLCHYPMLSWEASYHGSFQLHGHCHGTIPFDPQVRRLDVGVDCNNFYPFAWEDIKTKLLAVPSPKEKNSNNTEYAGPL